MRALLATVVLSFLIVNGGCFNFFSTNPSSIISVGKMMTGFIMTNMAKKRTRNRLCIQSVSNAAEDFFGETARALNLIRLISQTKARSNNPDIDTPAVPLDQFCALADVPRLRQATDSLVDKMRCVGAQAQEDAGRLFRSLVYTVGHVCLEGGKPAQQFLADIRRCRRLDPVHEERLGQVRRFHRSRRSLTAHPIPVIAGVTEPIAASPIPKPDTVTEAAPLLTPAARTTVATVAPYSSLQACFDDVNELLPVGARLAPQEEFSDFLLTLPRMIPHLLARDGLTQFCPALLKGADCAHYSVSQCPPDTQHKLARFFQTVLRGILCDGIPDDETLKAYILYPQAMQFYLNLSTLERK